MNTIREDIADAFVKAAEYLSTNDPGDVVLADVQIRGRSSVCG